MEEFEKRKEKAKELYKNIGSLYCPYFKEKITFNADGFHHLQFSARRERDKKSQLIKFRLLPLAMEVVRGSGTLQEFRELLTPDGRPSSKGEVSMKNIQYFAFIAIVGTNKTKVRVITRKVGNGNIHFWSVMPHSKIHKGKQRLFAEGLEDE